MTKTGYTHIIVPKDLHTHLKTLAEAQSLSISNLIKNVLSINTSINTTSCYAGFSSSQKSLNQASFQETSSSCVNQVVRLPGFEPGLEAWKASILNQSRSQPHKARIQSIIKTKYLLLS